MNEQKSFLMYIAEAIERYRGDRRRCPLQDGHRQPRRLSRILRWFVPNGGTLLLVTVLVLTANVWAKPLASPAAPGPSATTVNYQGRLADSGGSPLDGTYGMTFSLYDAPSGGSPVWGPESHTAVPVNDGLFSVGLGSQTGGGIPTSTWNGDRYLEITVGGETLSPRELIRSVPIAGMALTVPDGTITMDKLGEQPYYFHGAFATPSEWMADVIWNGNYARFCEAIGRTYVRAELLQEHYNISRGVGYFYQDWYYTGSRFCDSDTHIWGNGDPDNRYNVWQYEGGCGANITGQTIYWTRERSAVIWCE